MSAEDELAVRRDAAGEASTSSWNATWRHADAGLSWWTERVDASTVARSAAFVGVVLLALVGNGLVVAAVVSYRRLRSVTNHFVVSLAMRLASPA